MRLGIAKDRGARSIHSACAVVVCGAILAGARAASPAKAQVFDEVWIGGYAHDISDLGHGKESNTEDTQIEIDTVQPRFLRFLGAPHLNAVIALNSAGETDLGSIGLAWDRRVAGPVFASLQFGIGDSDGVPLPPTGPAGDSDRKSRLLIGSKALFREAAGLNWRLAPRWELGVQYVHASNGNILGHHYNEGINDLGLRLGYRFR